MSRLLGLRTIRPFLRQKPPLILRPYPVRFESNVTIQRTRVTRRKSGWKRVGTFLLYAAGTYLAVDTALRILELVYFGPFSEDIDEEEEVKSNEGTQVDPKRAAAIRRAMSRNPALAESSFEEGEEESVEATEDKIDEDEDDLEDIYVEDGIFIPLTWAKPLPREFYKGSDPEWQEFIKFSQDKERRQKAREDLVRLVRSHAAKSPQVRAHAGDINLNSGGVWFDTIFPYGPPLEYERSGLEILFLEDSIALAWSTKPDSQLNQQRLERIFSPIPAFEASLMTLSAFSQSAWLMMKQTLGLSPEPLQPHRNAPIVQDIQEMQNKSANTAVPKQPHPQSPPGADSALGARSPSTRQPPLGHQTKELTPFQYFTLIWASKVRPSKADPPRGTILFQGLTEVVGTRARVTLDVTACYDPKINQFVTLNVRGRNWQERQQRPRGGP